MLRVHSSSITVHIQGLGVAAHVARGLPVYVYKTTNQPTKVQILHRCIQYVALHCAQMEVGET